MPIGHCKCSHGCVAEQAWGDIALALDNKYCYLKVRVNLYWLSPSRTPFPPIKRRRIQIASSLFLLHTIQHTQMSNIYNNVPPAYVTAYSLQFKVLQVSVFFNDLSYLCLAEISWKQYDKSPLLVRQTIRRVNEFVQG